MKTAIDEIIEASNFFSIIDFKKWFTEEKERLKHKEKQQIIAAIEYDTEESYTGTLTGEQYYTSTFETKKL